MPRTITKTNNNLPEVTVYSRKGYNKLIAENEAKKAKYLADMGKYKKDSAEWVKANKAYNDSLSLHNAGLANGLDEAREWDRVWDKLRSPDQPKGTHVKEEIQLHNNPSSVKDRWSLIKRTNKFSESYKKNILKDYDFKDEMMVGKNYIEQLALYSKHAGDHRMTGAYEGDPSDTDINGLTDKQKADMYYKNSKNLTNLAKRSRATGIYPTHIVMPSEGLPGVIYKKPVNNPKEPIKPTSTEVAPKYDSTYESLRMRSLWANLAKQDSTAKIGTLKGIDPLFEQGFTITDARKFPQEIKDQHGLNYIDTNMKNKHAYGNRVRPKTTGADVAQVGLDTASGALAGAGTGAMLGSALGPMGTAAGAVIGGLIGLGKGIFGASSARRARAANSEAGRQQTIAAMDQRMEADGMSIDNSTRRSTTFYGNGGSMPMAGRRTGMVPMAHDSQLAVGPSHEQGGIPLGPNDEIEGGETIKQDGDTAMVFSDRLAVPGSKHTYADVSKILMQRKGILEKSFAGNESKISKELAVIDKPSSNVLKQGSSRRRAEISSNKNSAILNQIGEIDQQLQTLFEVQEQANGNAQAEAEQGQMAYGGRVEHRNGGSFTAKSDRLIQRQFNRDARIEARSLKNSIPNIGGDSGVSDGAFGSKQLMFQAGADILDTMSNAITSNQMSKLKQPAAPVIRTPRLNTYIDNSAAINSIDSSTTSLNKSITDNVRNPGIRRAYMMQIANQANQAKSSVMAQKYGMERELENKNVMLDYEVGKENATNAYSGRMLQYQASMAGLNRNSQISSNFADKIANIGSANAQIDSNNIALETLLMQYPEYDRNRMRAVISSRGKRRLGGRIPITIKI